MGERNMLCTHQTLGVEMEYGHNHLHSNFCSTLGNMVDLLNPSSNQVMPTSGNPVNLSQFASHHDDGTSHADLYNHHYCLQQQPPALSHQLDSAGRSNFDNSCTSTSSYIKGKNAAEVTGERNYVNDISNSASYPPALYLSSGMQSWNKPFDVGFSTMNFSEPENRGGFLQLMEGPQRSVMYPNIINQQMGSPLWHHRSHNHLLEGNYFSPTFQPGGTWVDQFRSNTGIHSMWNYPSAPCFEGSSLDFSRMGGPQGSSFGRAAFILNSPPLHCQHQYLQPVQSMQVPDYNYHPRIPVPSYGLPVNNLLHCGAINISREVIDTVIGVPRSLPSSTSERSHRPRQRLPQAHTDSSGNQMRIFVPQDNAVLEFPGIYGTESFFDQHRDMRLDIDNMSYEELLALEEQIGDVKTGLSEEAILKNLRTRTLCIPASSLNSLSDTAPEIGSCIICQAEYVENERIGTLHCGHDYHADCIKQWLLVKSLCPICKTSALDPDEREH